MKTDNSNMGFMVMPGKNSVKMIMPQFIKDCIKVQREQRKHLLNRVTKEIKSEHVRRIHLAQARRVKDYKTYDRNTAAKMHDFAMSLSESVRAETVKVR